VKSISRRFFALFLCFFVSFQPVASACPVTAPVVPVLGDRTPMAIDVKMCKYTGGFGSLGAGISNMGSFLLEGAGEVIKDTQGQVIGHAFTHAQVAARQLIAAGLNMGVSMGLSGLGLDPQLSQLAGAFVGGGFLGIGEAGTTFFRSGVQMAMMQGVSEMAVNIGLAPPITSALSVVATTGMGSLENGCKFFQKHRMVSF